MYYSTYVTVGGVVVTHTALVSVACGLISYYPSTATIVRFWGIVCMCAVRPNGVRLCCHILILFWNATQ